MSTPARVLIVHGDGSAAEALREVLSARKLEVEVTATAAEALAALEDRPFDAAVVALRLGGDGGLDLLGQIGRRWPDVRVIMVAAAAAVPEAVAAMRAGASDFLVEPFDPEQVSFVLDKAVDEARGEPDPEPRGKPGALVGQSRAMQQVFELVARAAQSNATVLIRGESGTGKELVARAVHEQSPRASGPFVKIHCAALPDTLLESELFGYEKGAFTGATHQRPGRVELAEGGTLFLDEIGDITPAMQVKLLRLLQDKEYERLGSGRVLKADVRFVAATHRDLDAMVKKGEFREDLFYRVNVVTLWLPPLRARRDDVVLLSKHFCAALGAANGKPNIELEAPAMEYLRQQRWPGNVRQLQNFIERLVVLSLGNKIELADVKRELGGSVQFATQATGQGTLHTTRRTGAGAAPVVPLSEELRATERAALERALRHTRGNRALAARLLGVSRATLYNKLQEHGLSARSDV